MSLVAALALTVLFASPAPEVVQRAVARVVADGGLQTERPHHQPPRSDPGRAPAPAGDPAATDPPPAPPDASGLAPLLRALLWTGLGVVALLVLAAVAARFRERPPPAPVRRTPAAPAAVEAPDLDAPLDAATALAAQSRYAEAAHALLLRTLARLAALDRLPASWTSREVLARIELPPPAHRALENLVQVTEISRFGGREVDAEAYQGCVAAFQHLRREIGA